MLCSKVTSNSFIRIKDDLLTNNTKSYSISNNILISLLRLIKIRGPPALGLGDPKVTASLKSYLKKVLV